MNENNQVATPTTQPQANAPKTKFCKHCGGKIPEDAVICTLCGRQVEDINKGANAAQPQIIINNDNINTNTNTNNVNAGGRGKEKNKWVALLPVSYTHLTLPTKA